MEDLPDQILLNIFSTVSYHDLCLGVRLTCKKWWGITQDQELWKHLEIPLHFSSKRLLLLISQVQDHIEYIDCSKCENLNEETFVKMSELSLPKLKYLAVPLNAVYPDAIYTNFAANAPNLSEIENLNGNVEDTAHPVLAQAGFKNLEVVYDKPMSSYGRIHKGNSQLNIQKKKLWSLELRILATKCKNVHSYKCRRGLDYVTDETIEEISQMFPELRFIELHYCSITDAGLPLFFKHQRGELREIILDKAGTLTDVGVKHIADYCPNLVNIKLSRIPAITDEGIRYLASKCKHLKEVHLNNSVITFEENAAEPKRVDFTDDCLQSLAKECNDLRFFRLFYSEAVSLEGVYGMLQHCRWIQGLMFYECSQIDDGCLNSFGALPCLKGLVLASCEKITPMGILDLILMAPNLSRLTMFSNNKLFYGDMTDQAENVFNKLETEADKLRPSVIKKVTFKCVGSAFVQLFTVLCPKLHTFDVREGCIVNVPALTNVMTSCESLSVLDVQYLPSLDDSFIYALIEHAPNLTKLALRNHVKSFSVKAMEDMMSKCKALCQVTMDAVGMAMDEDQLVKIAKEHHGGFCYKHVDPECLGPNKTSAHRDIELYMTPIKYLSSVGQVKESVCLSGNETSPGQQTN